MNAKEYALKLLSMKDYPEKDIKDKILKKGFPFDEMQDAIMFCKEYDYINDKRYAKRYIHDALNLKKHSPSKIRFDLISKNIDVQIIDELLLEIEFSANDAIDQIIEKRFSNVDFANSKEKNKVIGYFVRRGFKISDIYSCINKRHGEDDYYEE